MLGLKSPVGILKIHSTHTHKHRRTQPCTPAHTAMHTRSHPCTPAQRTPVHTRAHPCTPAHIPCIPAHGLNLINRMKSYINRPNIKKAEDRRKKKEGTRVRWGDQWTKNSTYFLTTSESFVHWCNSIRCVPKYQLVAWTYHVVLAIISSSSITWHQPPLPHHQHRGLFFQWLYWSWPTRPLSTYTIIKKLFSWWPWASFYNEVSWHHKKRPHTAC